MNKKHKGAHMEIRAAAWLLEQGYEVFRNVSPYGEIDLVAIKDGVVTALDVKCCYSGRSNKMGVSRIYPLADGSFRIIEGFVERRCPPLHPETPRQIVLRQIAEMAT
jgi:hypothetical protein